MTAEAAGMDALDGADRTAAETLLARLGDDEFVLAERYTEWQVRAPTLESDLALSNIAQDELGHARLWYDVLERFGHVERDIVFERPAADFRHATLMELPFAEGDWADAIVRSYLYDEAERLRLEAVADSQLEPVANRVPKILEEEKYHLDHARTWLERLADDAEGRDRLQAALDRLYGPATGLFEPADPPRFGDDADPAMTDPKAIEAHIVDAGFRTRSLSELQTAWEEAIASTCDSLGLDRPTEPTGPTGRNDHTEHWPALHAELTKTYHDLERTTTERIMPKPDDGE